MDQEFIDMVQIPAGTFMMGSPAGEPERDDDETQHQVTVSSFYMGKYVVTQKEYRKVMRKNPSLFKGDDRPVNQVNWYDAVEYCNSLSRREGLTPAYTIDKNRKDPNNTHEYDKIKWVVTWNRNADGYRLPTEAEWEYACRAGTTTPFNTGNSITRSQANFKRKKTTPVGSFSPNAWGLYDMHGNVLEWCWDWHGDYASGAQTDPTGAVSDYARVLRGGSYSYDSQELRSACRSLDYPYAGYCDHGFRLSRPL
jgi:formylglycine-generating enzyme required for sulfatase activity